MVSFGIFPCSGAFSRRCSLCGVNHTMCRFFTLLFCRFLSLCLLSSQVNNPRAGEMNVKYAPYAEDYRALNPNRCGVVAYVSGLGKGNVSIFRTNKKQGKLDSTTPSGGLYSGDASRMLSVYQLICVFTAEDRGQCTQSIE